MSDFITFITNLEWSDIIQSFASIFVAYVAYYALGTWKRQTKAEKQTNFLDELTDTVHEYLQQLKRPITKLQIIHIGFQNSTNSPDNKIGVEHPKVVAFIKEKGSENSKELLNYLEECNSSVLKIKSLMAKGQVYDLKQYEDCSSACEGLIWQYQRLEDIAYLIGNKNMNWHNPLVQEKLEEMLSVTPEEINNHFGKHYKKFIEFVKENYSAIYKSA